MKAETRPIDRSRNIHPNGTHRCSVCGKKMTAPQSILSRDGIGLCDTCYRESYFADMESNRRQVLNNCSA